MFLSKASSKQRPFSHGTNSEPSLDVAVLYYSAAFSLLSKRAILKLKTWFKQLHIHIGKMGILKEKFSIKKNNCNKNIFISPVYKTFYGCNSGEMKTDRLTDRKTDRQTDRQGGRQKDRT